MGAYRPGTILDVGAGTGYIARAIHERLTYKPNWILLDLNKERLSLASEHSPSDMAIELIHGDVFSAPLGARAFDAVLITFTLLEIDDIDRLCKLLATHMSPGAVLALAVPDAWVDVLEYANIDPCIIERYTAGPITIPKRDKFTGEEYPFRAVRIEDLLGRVLKAGFDLFDLSHGRAGTASAFVLAFRRRAYG